ncbi:MAG TPA: stage II sporulation protein M [Chitinophagaceae bacterium]
MREAQFLKQNADKWKLYEAEVRQDASADLLAERFIELTDDLAYARTFYPESNTTRYLNGLAGHFHQKIYRNKIEDRKRIWWFWQYELPFLFRKYHRQFLYSFLFFIVFCAIGALSAKHDENFLRLILGDAYVNMTNQNIEKGDPFGVYKDSQSFTMFMLIAFNNIRVAFIAYVLGATACVGTVMLLFSNGLMLGSFEYFFFSKGLGTHSILVVFIHGTLEIWAIVIAGAAGLVLGTSVLFPGTYSRGYSFIRGGKDGLKIVIGLVPVFLTAAFLESYVTRHTGMPLWLSTGILAASLLFIAWYFIFYPIRLHRRIESSTRRAVFTNNSFDLWLNKKFISGN